MVAALKQIGFDYVFDTNFAADLTIMEEGSEFVERFTHKSRYRWPMFTSCCPSWVRFLRSQYPDYVSSLSTAKSPQQMFGAVAKSYFAEKMGLDPHKIMVVSMMPCTAKKAECTLPEMTSACGDPDVDVVLTTREMCRLFRSDCIVPTELPEMEFDSPRRSAAPTTWSREKIPMRTPSGKFAAASRGRRLCSPFPAPARCGWRQSAAFLTSGR